MRTVLARASDWNGNACNKIMLHVVSEHVIVLLEEIVFGIDLQLLGLLWKWEVHGSGWDSSAVVVFNLG
jgi:hypothetical protein